MKQIAFLLSLTFVVACDKESIEKGVPVLTVEVEPNAVRRNEMKWIYISAGMQSMEANLGKLKPVIDAHNAEYEALQKREAEMEKLIHEFKNSLLIEKIKMDTWENKNRT